MLNIENRSSIPSGFINTVSSSIVGDTSSTNSSSHSNFLLTPEDGSSGSREGNAQSSHREQHLSELGRLQTNFHSDQHNESFAESRKLEHRAYGSDMSDNSEDCTPKEAEAYSYTDEPTLKSYTLEEERRVVKKFDLRLTMFMALLYMLSFVDRSNIGNARIAGMEKALKLGSPQFEWILTSFYITYICFEWMTLMYTVVPAHVYISICCFSWGLIAACQSLVSSFWALVLLRALLGIAEAAFGPGLPFFLSFFYKREELAYRTGMFISAAPLATSFASTLAWAIVKLSEHGPVAPWRALLLFEGFPSVIVAVFAWIYVPDSPSKARYLTPRERKVAKMRLKMSDRENIRKRRFKWSDIGRTLRDPKSYLTAFMFFSCNVAFSSMPVFLPTIMKDMGYSALTSQALSAPPYILSFLVVLLTGSLSDRHRSRSPYLITHALISATAYLTIALAGHFHSHLSSTLQILIRYIAIYPATAGFFSSITIIVTWTMDNQPAKEAKGTGMAILNIIGQCGPLVGTRLYPRADGPWYVRGMAVCALFMLLVAALALVLRVLLQRENERARAGAGAVDAHVHVDEIEMVEGEAAGLMGRGSGFNSASGSGSGSAGLSRAVREKNTNDGQFVYIV
ncbi:MFS transporter [Histoplasma capsulatum G186AR]|uniref:MFS transporter n=1 Tax=Ajellomyces capsulatus TaxID=5037 RepID=A0A8H7Y9L0_AJECA|nr:MFS transporter [Histoplasma capsulatum]QSS75622.1 MFS transporter [Histoplasma capsulatum G186AR]